MAEKKDKLDWFPLYAYEFITDIAGWTNAEVGAYCRLLFVQWINEELPGDLQRLAGICNEPLEDFQKIWEHIGSKFTIIGNKHFNEKLEKIRKQQYKLIEKKSDAGSEGATARWHKFVKPTIDEIRAYCIQRKNGIDPEAFFAFYESKGWKVGSQAMKNWQSAIITWEKRNKNNPKGSTNILVKRESIVTDSERRKTAELHKHLESNPPIEDKKQGGMGSLLKKEMERLAPKKENL